MRMWTLWGKTLIAEPGGTKISPGLRAIPNAGKGVIAFDVKEDTRTVRILSITWGGADWMGKIAARVVRGAAGRDEKRVPGPRGPGSDAAGDREPFLIRHRDRDVIRPGTMTARAAGG